MNGDAEANASLGRNKQKLYERANSSPKPISTLFLTSRPQTVRCQTRSGVHSHVKPQSKPILHHNSVRALQLAGFHHCLRCSLTPRLH